MVLSLFIIIGIPISYCILQPATATTDNIDVNTSSMAGDSKHFISHNYEKMVKALGEVCGVILVGTKTYIAVAVTLMQHLSDPQV